MLRRFQSSFSDFIAVLSFTAQELGILNSTYCGAND
jgi:hypothetical protein